MATLHTLEEVEEYLGSFDLFQGNEAEGRGYVEEALRRFLITVLMVPPAVRPSDNRLLELGANPYFLTLLLKQYHRYELALGNYFLPDAPSEGSQTIRSELYGETHTFSYAHFNVERDRFPFPDQEFDGVLFCEILEHLVLDPYPALSEIHRVLKPGGFLLLSTPNVLCWGNLWKLAGGRNIYDRYSGYGVYGRHNREYTAAEVARLLEETGFQLEAVRHEDLHAIPSWQRLLGRFFPGRNAHLFFLARPNQPPQRRDRAWLHRSRDGGSKRTNSSGFASCLKKNGIIPALMPTNRRSLPDPIRGHDLGPLPDSRIPLHVFCGLSGESIRSGTSKGNSETDEGDACFGT